MGYVVWCFHATVHTLSAQWMDIERMDLVAQFAFSLLFIGWWLYCCSVHIRFIYLYICVLDTTILYLFNVHHQLFCAVFYFSPLLCCYGAMREAHQNHNTHHPSGHSKAWLPAKLFQMWNCSTTQKFISLVFVGWFDWPAAHITHTKSKMPCWMWFVFVFFYFFIVFCVCCYYTGCARWTTIHLPIPIFSIESTHHPHVCVCELALLSGAWLKFHYDICDERWHRSFNSSTKPINSKSIESGVIILKIDFISMQCICWGHEQQSSNLIREYYFILHVYTNNMMAYKQNLLWECYRKIWTMRMRRLYFDGLYLINFSLIILSMTAFNNFERLSPRKCMHLIRGRFW